MNSKHILSLLVLTLAAAADASGQQDDGIYLPEACIECSTCAANLQVDLDACATTYGDGPGGCAEAAAVAIQAAASEERMIRECMESNTILIPGAEDPLPTPGKKQEYCENFAADADFTGTIIADCESNQGTCEEKWRDDDDHEDCFEACVPDCNMLLAGNGGTTPDPDPNGDDDDSDAGGIETIDVPLDPTPVVNSKIMTEEEVCESNGDEWRDGACVLQGDDENEEDGTGMR